MYRNNDNQLYFRDLNDINSKIMNLQDKYNNYMIENSNDKAYVPVYGSGRSGGMREYPKNYSGGALYNPMNGVSPINNSFNVDRMKRDRLGGSNYYYTQPEPIAPAPAAIELFDPFEADLPEILPKMKVGVVKKLKRSTHPMPTSPPPLIPSEGEEKSFLEKATEKIFSLFGDGKKKMTKAQIKKIEELFKSKGHILGGAWYNEVAKWGKEQLKQQGDNTYAKAGISAIDDLNLGGKKNMKGGAWWDDISNFFTRDIPSAVDMGATAINNAVLDARDMIGVGKAGTGLVLKPMRSGKAGAGKAGAAMPKPSGKAGAGKSGGKHVDRKKLVKEIMASQGKSMIEASKYIKQHNLYKKK